MVKIEIEENDKTGITAFSFISSNLEDLPILDKLRVAFLGNHEKIGGYESSNHLVIKTRIPSESL